MYVSINLLKYNWMFPTHVFKQGPVVQATNAVILKAHKQRWT